MQGERMDAAQPSMPEADDSPERGRLRFQPGLDGLRGLSVLGILLFHSDFAWAAGGFLGVSTFFTLSGFLITSLFLVEHERSGRIDLFAFWGRRFRRLMPASLLALAAIALFGLTVASPEQLARLRGDILWALAYVANWRFVFSEVSYARLFTAPSPVLHFWSLGIEEQLYLALPIAVAAGLRIGSGSRATLARLIAVLVAASLAATVALWHADAGIDRIYYGTDTRAAELLIGALLALWLQGRSLTGAALRAVQVVGCAALLATLGAWATLDVEAELLHRGGFAVYALLSSAVIAAAVQPAGPVRAALSGRAIRWLGRISYGLYLFHWPIFLWLTPERTGLADAPLFALRVGLSLALAWASYVSIEVPIRTRRLLVGRRAKFITLSAFAAVAGVALALPVRSGVDAIDFSESSATDRAASDDESASDPPSRFRAAPRVAVFGDSAALQLHTGLGRWLLETEGVEMRRGWTKPGCGIARAGRYRFRRGERGAPRICRNRNEEWERRLDKATPDVAVVFAGPWEVADRKLPGEDRWRKPGDPAFDDYLRAEMLAAVDVLSSRGSLVVWLTHPAIEVHEKGGGGLPETPFPASDPARMARFNELVGELESLRPGKVRSVDLAGYMRGLPGGEMDPSYRRDGVHFGTKSAYRVAADWLGPEILRSYREEAKRR
jgi:peptidoglycan/LPS O-acetylase OafA/YrhL